MRRGVSPGFTLIEIMLVVGLVGIIAAAALAPLVFTIRSLEDAQRRWGSSHNTAAAVDKIYSDIRRVIPNPSFSTFKIIHKSGFSTEADDRLVMWSAAPKYEGKNVGVVVYKIVTKGILNNAKPGLYRWVLANVPSEATVSGDISGRSPSEPDTPMDVNTDELDPKGAKLVLADAIGVKFYVWQGNKWAQEYDGKLPNLLKTEIITKEGSYSHTERFPNAAEK
ncbi:type II secretion system protein [Cloacibacillus sp.]|uniref:pilus assembly FimT family protein n=1 Tax=Cloacibacillus sp. TaxID=2049023 RepID=UPI0025B9146B|nr:type II secretion system protein [Cloacibacillus sp.]MCC8057719.1 type II secretion system GspH family protein [Cloacibacillus sp.]